MTRDDVIDLLTMAAAFDLRTIGEADVSAWLAVATEQGWTFATARRALVEHYATHTERIMPGHITATLNAVHRKVRATLDGYQVRAPVEYRDDPRAEARFVRSELHRLVADGMQQWAADGRVTP